MESTTQLTPEIIEGFTRSILASRYDDPKPIPPFHRELWELCCAEDQKVAIAAPRGHAKSTAITMAFVLAGLMFRQFQHVLILSANETLAAGFVGNIRNEIAENEMLRRTFGVGKFIKESESEIIVQFKDGHKFRVLAKGANQRMRGLNWQNKRPDLVIGDDLEDDEIVLNVERREKFENWFMGAVLPIISHRGKVRLVGTIVHMDSLLENLMPKTKDPATIITPIKTSSTRIIRGFRSVKYRAHSPDFEDILWPEQFPPERLRAIRQEHAEAGKLDIYGQEYLNDPIDPTTAYFRKEDFLTLTDEMRGYPATAYCAVDFAISKKQKADYTVITGVRLDHEGNIQVVYMSRGRWDSREIMEEMFIAQERLKPAVFFAESGQIERAIGPILYEEMRKKGKYINLETMPPMADKETRSRPLQARMRAGSVFFDKEASWYSDMEEELTRFPKAPHDDIVDSLAWIGLALDKLVEADTPEEMEEEEYEEAFRLSGYANEGRSKITGY